MEGWKGALLENCPRKCFPRSSHQDAEATVAVKEGAGLHLEWRNLAQSSTCFWFFTFKRKELMEACSKEATESRECTAPLDLLKETLKGQCVKAER